MRLKLILDARMPLGIWHFWFKICFPFLCFVGTALRPVSSDLALLLTVLRPFPIWNYDAAQFYFHKELILCRRLDANDSQVFPLVFKLIC